MESFEDVIKKIVMERDYYNLPVLDKLSEYDKGVHKGRAEGLQIALNYIGSFAKSMIEKEKLKG